MEMTYYAKGNEIYVRNRDSGQDELFLTVHPTACSIPIAEQTDNLVEILNDLPGR